MDVVEELRQREALLHAWARRDNYACSMHACMHGARAWGSTAPSLISSPFHSNLHYFLNEWKVADPRLDRDCGGTSQSSRAHSIIGLYIYRPIVFNR
jgi:hypothetical protein